MEGMGQFPDNYFDLAIVDPPYGIGEDGGKFRGRKKDNYRRIVIHKKKNWDKKPDVKYFDELKRVSKHQIIWGGNYFTSMLSEKMGWIFWDKLIGGDFSDGELAWTSFDKALKKVTYSYHGDTKGGHLRIHPTQKPIYVYRWILKEYGQAGWKILDTHVGSGSSLIACEREGFNYVGFEIDPDYYKAAMERIKRERQQLTLALQ